MKTSPFLLALAAAATLILTPSAARAADAKTYQVTGPILEITDTYIVVQKGEDKWQLARNKDTKANAALKVGAKVTIEYQMVAKDIEVKSDKKPEARPETKPTDKKTAK